MSAKSFARYLGQRICPPGFTFSVFQRSSFWVGCNSSQVRVKYTPTMGRVDEVFRYVQGDLKEKNVYMITPLYVFRSTKRRWPRAEIYPFPALSTHPQSTSPAKPQQGMIQVPLYVHICTFRTFPSVMFLRFCRG